VQRAVTRQAGYDETVLAPASETTIVPCRLMPNLNGTLLLETVKTGVPGRPYRSSGSVSSRFATRSLITSEWPSGMTETCAAPAAPGASSRVPIARSEPPCERQNAVTLGASPELRT
jgi:hypothetical protein